MNQILLDAGIVSKDGWLTYYHPEQTLKLRDTAENRSKLEAFVERRGLAAQDLRFPKAHHDDRSIRQRIAEDGQVTTSKDLPKSKADILRETLRVHNEVRGKEDFDKHMERQILAAEISEEIELSEAERAAKAEPRVEHATWAYLELAFSDCPQSVLSQAAKRLQIAREGTASDYKAADAEYRAQVKQNAELAKANLEGQFQQQQQALTQQLESVNSAAWVDAPAESPAL